MMAQRKVNPRLSKLRFDVEYGNRLCHSLLLKASFLSRPRTGFTLIELVVASLLLALLITATLSLFTTSTRAVRKTDSYVEANAIIDRNISSIRKKADQYSCCSGVCTSTPQATCGLSPLPDSLDFFPNPIIGSSGNVNYADHVDLFVQKCRSTTDSSHLTYELITEINEDVPIPLGLTRSVVKDRTGVAGDYLIRVTYSSSGSSNGKTYPSSINRVAKILPPVSAWCP